MIDPDHRQQVEDWLGRPLTDDELRPVASLDAVTDEQLAVVAAIRPRNLIAPQLFVRAIVPTARPSDIRRIVDEIDDMISARRRPEWSNLALFERYLGRPLVAAEKSSAPALDTLSSAQLAVATAIARQEITVACLYLHRIAPTEHVDACQVLAKQLAK